jgi:hypothetical protein
MNCNMGCGSSKAGDADLVARRARSLNVTTSLPSLIFRRWREEVARKLEASQKEGREKTENPISLDEFGQSLGRVAPQTVREQMVPLLAPLRDELGRLWVERGAGRGSRTPKTRRSADFESAASASSAIPAWCREGESNPQDPSL